MPEIEIFRTGTHTDSNGVTRTWSEADLDRIVAGYDPSRHEAPVVVGHPKDNAPAYGWVKGLRRAGDRLRATVDLLPEFAEALARGLYKKRSMAVYPDMSLRHVGFLGAHPPAVKGLADFAFAEGDAVTIDLAESMPASAVARVFRRIREYIIGKDGQDEADRVVGEWDIKEMEEEGLPKAAPAFSENEKGDEMGRIEELEAEVAALKGKASEFAEAEKAKDARLAALDAELATERAKARRQEFAAFCEGDGMKGRITPAMKPAVMDFMDILSGVESYEFAEGDGRKADRPVERFKAFLSALPAQVEFSEHATRGRAVAGIDMADPEAIAKAAVEFRESERAAGRDISATQAVVHVTQGGKS